MTDDYQGLRDLPESCLTGRLGEICTKRMAIFPRAYAWPALLTVGGSMIDQDIGPFAGHVNLYSALVGPVHSGKTQAMQAAIKTLGLETPTLMRSYSGSAEAVARSLKGATGNPRLWILDEMSVMLQKTRVENSSLAQVLCDAFYHRTFRMNMGRKEVVDVDCDLSILGGLVDESFSSMFSHETTKGLYDRFIFGLCPGNYEFEYWPVNGSREIIKPRVFAELLIDPEIWEWRKVFERENKDVNRRVVELALRAALICTYFDGGRLLDLKQIEPVKSFIKYQTRMRTLLRPNPGETTQGQIAHRLLQYLESHPGFQRRRDVFRRAHLYDLGARNAESELSILIANGDIIEQKIEPPTGPKVSMIRLALPSENGEPE